MNSLSLALTATAIVSGLGLFGVACDTVQYNHIPRNRWKWLVGLLISTSVLLFLAILTNGKDCTDYTANDYKYGYVPVSCPGRGEGDL